MERIKASIKGKSLPKPIFTDSYFLSKAIEMEQLGADMITIKDMSGLIPPEKVSKLISLFKKYIKVPIDFHTHCTPGFGLASVITAIIKGVDIVDTNIWYFSGGPAAPAIELIYLFCKKLGIEIDVNMEAVAKINKELYSIRQELSEFDAIKKMPKNFNPLTDALPAEIDKAIDKTIELCKKGNFEDMLEQCHKIEAHFGFPAPNDLVKSAQIPGGMYTNMVAQLKQLDAEEILNKAMELIPTVRLDAGLPPLVTPTSQIVGAQAVNCALDIKNGKPMYSNVSNQFASLVKGEYGRTPIAVKEEFREKITGSPKETPYDTSKYQMQPNPILSNCGDTKLAINDKEVLLLELFPSIAKTFLTKKREAAYQMDKQVVMESAYIEDVDSSEAITGQVITSPMPGTVFKINVKPGDTIKVGDSVIILESMKMENNISTTFSGKVKRVLVKENQRVNDTTPLIEIE